MLQGGAESKTFGRYRVLELLGQGAHGDVFAVEDSVLGGRVALKVLRSGSGSAADLKREFRFVADLTHPNLVLPYTLETGDDQVFFTMELVSGQPILDFLANQPADERPERIRSTFAQVVEGLLALHERGLVHRDVKPSNILVQPCGRVAILDFGLVRRVEVPSESSSPYLAGTPGFLAPELLFGAPASTASDAYAVGVLLHQALTGTWPFHDDVRQSVSLRAQATAAPGVRAAPESLSSLCEALLHPDPRQRLTLGEAANALGAGRSTRLPFVTQGRVLERDDELARLERLHQRFRERKQPTVVRLPGQSGMGKSALMATFARRIHSDAWVLEARAYERDAVPYKALDAAMDQLAGRLAALSDAERSALLPSEPEALHVIFPVLAQALGVEAKPSAPMDPVARLRWGTRTLRELLARVTARFAVVFMLDDLQWGDLDSARLLVDLLAPPGPAMLVVLAYRSEATRAPFLELYGRWETDNLAAIAAETIPVEALSLESSVRLVTALAGDAARAADVARDSGGSPFIIELLLSTSGEALGLDKALAHRLARLTEPARQMLEAVCLAARPLARELVPFAPARPEDARAAWTVLAGARLLRSSGYADQVEAYHDRIRDAVTRALSVEARRATHLALGDSFATIEDAEGAAFHLAAAGEKTRAYKFARSAAKSALDALAFDRAAELLALALECRTTLDDERHEVVLQRARALSNAGRCAEAAPLFLECADNATGLAALDLTRAAMEHFLIAGRIDEGRPLMKRLLSDLGLWQPRSEVLSKAALYTEFARLWIRGPKLARPRELRPRDRLVLDTLGSLGKGFASYDTNLGARFFLRAARLALDWGETKLAIRGIAYMASLLGFSGSPGGRKQADTWLAAGEALATADADGHSLAFCQVGRGMIEVCAGEWRKSIATFDAAVKVLDDCAASDWEVATAKNTPLFSLVQLGDIHELDARATTLSQEARKRGDLALEVESNLYLALAALARNDPEDAHRCVDRNLRLWTIRGYHFQHWIALRFRTLSRLYEGACVEALAQMDEELPRARAADLTSMQVVRIEASDLHGRASLGALERAGAHGRGRARLTAGVMADIRALEGEKVPHALAPAENLRAGLAVLAQDRAAAVRHLERAARAYDDADMLLHALTARWQSATLAVDEARAATIETTLRERGVAAPARWARMHFGVGMV